jgi:hypothetical protein
MKEPAMFRRISVFAVLLVVFNVMCPATPAQSNPEPPQPPIFTYVAEWGVPRAQWADMEKVNASNKATLDSLVADGTLLGYGMYENRIHSEGGITHGSWFQAASLANIFKALDKIYAQPGVVTSPVQAASKHLDYLMISTTHGGKAVTNSTGYLRVISAQIKPGKGSEFRDAYHRYIEPVYAKLLADGAIVAYQLDTEYNIENAPGRVFSVAVTRDADGLDKMGMAFHDLFEKNPAVDEALASAIEPNSRNDLLARVTSMSHK